ncbi:SigE family RNA polymerase sigma factor [Actinopolymorpha pittospori]|uniref:RNA polymerase sigma-70 factor (Sigma-E family) n=1 Tax=Actinopolymorpha pittospori TaxID=648752 RepID=A0A927RJX4_9ACTN|nr:RNA polymerase sigma-70 factor (sigma-E family) [Actinopolymorpha pittospori]
MTDVAEEFAAYVASRQRALVRTAYLLTGDLHEAEDLVQSALTRTYLAWHRIRDRNSVDAYVRRVLINEHHSWWRRAWRRAERSTDTLPERPGAADSRFEERDEMWELVQTLPPRQRAVVVLRFYEDLSPTEIAAALGCSVGTVGSQTSRALAALRARYEQSPDASEATRRRAGSGHGNAERGA